MGWAAHFSLWPNTPKGQAGPAWPNYCSSHVGPKETTGRAIVPTRCQPTWTFQISLFPFSFFLFIMCQMSIMPISTTI